MQTDRSCAGGLQWLDDEGDWIELQSELEFREAKRVAAGQQPQQDGGVLKIRVV